jgi:hypothetical protein
MYFWNTKALSEDIKHDKLSDNDWKNYYLVALILVGAAFYMADFSPAASKDVALISIILSIVIVFFGVNKTFNTHTVNGDGASRYIANMVALTVPLTVKFFLLSSFLVIFSGFTLFFAIKASGSHIDFDRSFEWFSYVVVRPAIIVLMFWRYNIHIQNLNS